MRKRSRTRRGKRRPGARAASLGVPRAAETEIVQTAVGGSLVPRGDAVAHAIVFAAHPRSPADDALLAGLGAAGIFFGAGGGVGGIEPVVAPFPDVAGDVAQAVAVGRE